MADAAAPLGAAVRVVVYSAAGCSLCAPAKEAVARVLAELAAEAGAPVAVLEEVAIDGDAALEERYRAELPVVEVDGRKAAKYHVDEDVLAARIRRARVRRAAQGGA